jgi:hypothetical protein
MHIDRTHRSWFIASLTILTIATLAYIPYALFYPGGPRGNSLPGLVYGIVGYGMMLFAGLLGARKKVPIWRIGRAQTWMRGHLWLGALSLPMILFHAAFSARGPLTLVMTILLWVVVLSGITGAVIQHFVPTQMYWSVPQETIFEEIPTVRDQLLAEAAAMVDKLCAEPQAAALAAASLETGRAPVAVVEEEDEIVLGDEERANLRRVYVDEILPFLRNPDRRDSPLSVSAESQRFFEALRRQSPPPIHESLRDLESICSEERQLSRQRRVYFLLHGWLLVHVPLSITLLVLGGIHALVAIRY